MYSAATDPASVAFVVKCFLLQAINAEELRTWAEHALMAGEDCPIFVEGLAEFDGRGEEVYRTLGFVPERRFSAPEQAALVALAVARERVPGKADDPQSQAQAVLERHPEIVAEFRAVFGFLALRDGPGSGVF